MTRNERPETVDCCRCGHAYPPAQMAEVETADGGLDWQCLPDACRNPEAAA